MNARGELETRLGVPPPWIVGIINVTVDSFSDGGNFLTPAQAITHGIKLLEQGAHILDIGAESTGPGSRPISATEEFTRIKDVVRELSKHAFVSVDTYKASTATQCLELGAQMVNDVSAFRADNEMPDVVAAKNVFIVLMYSKQTGPFPHVDEVDRGYEDVVQEIGDFLRARAKYAIEKGISPSRIILDPGMGRYLSTRPEISWDILSRLAELCTLVSPYPLYLGTSRKGFLGGKLAERDPISQLTGALAVQKGVSFLRTHNVKMARDFLSALAKLRPVENEST